MSSLNPHQEEQKKLKVSLIIILALMVWGLIFNEITESNIVELDTGSYIISGLIGIVTIYVSRLQDRPSSRMHPLGYIGFIPILNLLRSLMIILICLKAIGESIGALVTGPEVTEHGIVFLYAGVTLIFNVIAYFYTHNAAIKIKSDILRIDALEWGIDIFYNFCIIISFGISYGLVHLGYTSLANHIDPIFCILLSIGMGIKPVQLFVENIRKLAIRSVEDSIQTNLVNRFYHEIPHFHAFTPYFTAIDMSGVLWVEVQFNMTNNKMAREQLTPELLKGWTLAGTAILKEINPNHHLTFTLK